jgi:glutamine cyclotransferase
MRFSTFTGEGWGLTHYGLTMVCSDGSQFLTFWKAPQRQRPKPRVVRRDVMDPYIELIEIVSQNYFCIYINYFYDQLRQTQVVDPQTGQAQGRINELEFVYGYIYANIWSVVDYLCAGILISFMTIFFPRYADEIIKIDPDSGNIVRRFDLTELYPKNNRIAEADCLNGIAFNSSSNTFLVTGKNWPMYYEIELPGVNEDQIEYAQKQAKSSVDREL